MATPYQIATPAATEAIDIAKYEYLMQICAGTIIMVMIIAVIWHDLREWKKVITYKPSAKNTLNYILFLLLVTAVGTLMIMILIEVNGTIADQIVDQFPSGPPQVILEYDTLYGFVELVINAFVAILCAVGMCIYILRWWIVIAILILWIAIITPRRN